MSRLRDVVIPPWVRLGAMLLLALGVLALAYVIVDRLFFAPDRAADAAIGAKVETGAAQVQAGNAIDAVGVGQSKVERETRIERITRENTVRIMAAPGASEPIAPAVDRELMASLCLRREATRADPACADVPRPGEGHAGEADALGADPAGAD